MNKNATYVMLGMVIFTAISWVSVFQNADTDRKVFAEGLAKAEKYEEYGIYVDAIEEYDQLLTINPDDYSIVMKYAKANYKLERYKAFLAACDDARALEPDNPEPLVLQIEYYIKVNRLQTAYDLARTANKAMPDSEEIQQKLDGFIGQYKEFYYYFGNISDWYNDYASASIDKKWGIIDTDGNNVIPCEFEAIGMLSDKNAEQVMVVPVMKDGEWYYADEEGNRKLVSDITYDYLGTFGDDYAPAGADGKYGYIDIAFEEFAFEFDGAGAFSNGTACVSKNGKWALINTKFEAVTEYVYDEIVMDTYGFCSAYGRVFAKINNKYILLDLAGNQVGSLTFDDVKLFASTKPAAVKIGDKWGFVAQDGTMACAAAYFDATSYASGMAGYSDGKLWGIIDMDQKFIIEPTFNEVKAFSRNGSFSYSKSYGWLLNAMYAYDESEEVK